MPRYLSPSATTVLSRGLAGVFLIVAMAFAPETRAGHEQAPVLRLAETNSSDTARASELRECLRQGRKLEVERRWADALTHYEEAVRRFPEESTLQHRFEASRLHYDLGRRYSDRSFRQVLRQLSASEALTIYAEVALKIEAHYVDVPNWKEIVERGSHNLEIALREPAFTDANVPEGKREFIGGFRDELRRLLGPRVIESRQAAKEAVWVAVSLANKRLDVPPTAAILEYLCGATNTLDPYSAYLTPDQLTEVYAQIDGNFVGLGIELKAESQTLTIVRVITGSPAEKAGMRANDRIVSVDGRSTTDLTADGAANLLQGLAGTIVRLGVTAPGQPVRELSVRRERVEVPSVDNVRIVDTKHGTGYVRLTCFQKTTCRDLDSALWKLHRQGMKRLIVDMRGNPGGLLITAVEVADMFLERGIIVSTRGRSAQEDFTYPAHNVGTWRVPLVILIDQDSASAAEIFAGAIHDHRRGTIVGQRSYGKGSVQGIFPLDSIKAGLRLTTAKFYSPAGRPYSGKGVEPDVPVRITARPIDGQIPMTLVQEDDVMLTAAIHAAQRFGTQQR